jgi:cell division protein FtsA
MLQPLASSAAVMSEQDIEAGIAILDIGGGTTDLAVFYEGILKHTAVIPFGGENITNDIKMGLGVLKSHAEQMKLQFGSALADAAHQNAFIKIPSLRGLPSKDISVKNLAGIIQARMSEILAFVTFHLKQVGLDNKMLNGGIVLTGGGSQLKHLIQLTEYVTGLNARIGYPNEHLAGNHIERMEKPMYATCIGLILKGYSVYESSLNELKAENSNAITESIKPAADQPKEEVVLHTLNKKPKTFKEFMNSLKGGLIDLFKEEGDMKL